MTFSLALAEGALRLLNKGVVIYDPVLMRRLPPGGEIDLNGFRNPRVLSNYDIVALGDSQTYGLGVLSREAWPSQLSALSGLKVYNIGIGGYGPLQYWHLLDQALGFNPKVVIWGLYLGNDLYDAYKLCYETDPTGHWVGFRNPDLAHQINQSRQAGNRQDEQGQLFSKIKNFMENYSATYVFFIQSTYIMRYKLGWEKIKTIYARRWVAKYPYAGCSFDESGIDTVFTTALRINAINLENPQIAEGLRITLKLIVDAQSKLMKKNIILLIAIIPSKESVYAQLMASHSTHRNEGYEKVVKMEAAAKDKILAFCQENGVYCVDTLTYLQKRLAENSTLYSRDDDSHPRAGGHAAIASGVHKFLLEDHLVSKDF